MAGRCTTLPQRLRVRKLSDHPRRATALIGAAALCVGVLYTGAATARLYAEVFGRPRADNASHLDAYFAPTRVTSAARLRDAVVAATWPSDADVLVVADPSLGRQTIYQTYYSTSYVLYPRRVWLLPTCDSETVDAAVARHDARYVVSIGRAPVIPHGERRPVSDMFTLVELR